MDEQTKIQLLLATERDLIAATVRLARGERLPIAEEHSLLRRAELTNKLGDLPVELRSAELACALGCALLAVDGFAAAVFA